MSFTVTARGDALLKAVEEFSGNAPGSGALMTFKDSGWLISSTVRLSLILQVSLRM